MTSLQSTFMEEALDHKETIPQRYRSIAALYDGFTDYERVHHDRAVELVPLSPRASVLDVACGTGRGLAALSGRLDPDVTRFGVDITPEMLARARRRFSKLGLSDVTELTSASAEELPFADETFDLVYSGYFFDLVKLEQIPTIVREMKRVLKPGGKIVLVNMSKNVSHRTRYERLYARRRLGIFSGGCRPVLMSSCLAVEGFAQIQRYYQRNRSLFFLNKMFGTEIVIGTR